MQGRHNKTAAGDCLGGTYFAIYHRKVISQLIQITNVGFERFWWSEIPSLYQRRLIQKGLKKEKYDTGKLLNFLLLEQGESLLFKNSSSLYHIGGVSAYNTFSMNQLWVRHLKALGSESQKSTELNQVEDLATLGMLVTDNEWVKLVKNHNSISRRRLTVSRYITLLLHALFEYSPLPAIPDFDDLGLKKNIELVTSSIVTLYDEFKEHFINI
jgi:hypothetical protein